MKNLWKSGIFHLFLSLAMASLFMACEKDDEPPDPSGALPNVEFTYSPMDIYTGLEINDYNAPTHIAVDFPVGYDELGTWKKVEIDYGNGVVDIYEPYERGAGINWVIYYSPGTYNITVRVYNSSGMKELSKEIEIFSSQSLKTLYLDGSWSIIHDKMSPASGVPIENLRNKYHKMFGFETRDNQNFNYSRLDMHWVEEEYGTFTVNGFNINTAPVGSDFPALTLTIDSFYRFNGEVHLAMHTVMTDDDIGEILYEADLIQISKDDPLYEFNTDLDNKKWNIIEEESNIYAYSDQTLEYSELVENIPNQIIPNNLLTVDLRGNPENRLIIDNWNEGSYEEIFNYYRDRIFYRLKLGEYDSIQLVYALFDPEYANSDPNVYSLITATFIEENGERLRIETKNKMRISDGSEATIDRDTIVGSWEIVNKNETIDGNNVDPGNSETPKVGEVLTFNTDGSADLGGSSETWLMLDDCNFVIVTGGDEILVHVNSYDELTNELEIMSITNENEDDYKLVYQLIKE